jgi:hypothetical protein
MRNVVYAVTLCLTACATAAPVALPNGTKGYSIDCSGGGFSIADCMNKAAEVCKGSYQIVGQDSASTGGVVMPAGNGGVFIAGMQRTMIVSCGAH